MRKYWYLATSLFVAFILLQQHAIGQLMTTFVQGSILLKDGEKLSGLIKAEPMSSMNIRINFKNTEADKTVEKYDTGEVKTVELSDGGIFEFLRFKLEERADSTAVLAKLVIRGSASLYKLNYNSKLFFLVRNKALVFLLRDDEQLSTNSTQMISHYYKNRLNDALFNSPAFVNEINALSFNEDALLRIITSYNKSVNSPNEIIKEKKSIARFLIFGVGGMYQKTNDNEMYVQAAMRTYFPRISKSASLNVGVNYFNKKYTAASYYNSAVKYGFQLISIPLQVQQNILNAGFRPYCFAGFNLSYVKSEDEFGHPQTGTGFQNNFGVGILYGGGIEIDIYRGLMLKGEYRYENIGHLVMAGLSYHLLLD